MDNIEKLYGEWLSLQPLKEEDSIRLNQKFMLEFNYNSNHMEGNTLTYGQTELLLLFGKVIGEANMKDLEEMKAHNVGLKMMQVEAAEKIHPLTETFIRQLHHTLLREDYTVYRRLPDGTTTSYVIHAGCYKTRPNSVITVTGESFEYASPEETPALMNDLVQWYNKAEVAGEMSPIELAAVFHYRYIRIHPFEDGNGRIARLMVNYILSRHNYPMIVIKTKDKANYLRALSAADAAVGSIPAEGAKASFGQIKPFINYMKHVLEEELDIELKIIHRHSGKLWYMNGEVILFRRPDTEKIIEQISSNPKITVRELSDVLTINKSAVQKEIKELQNKEYIKREGGTRGRWHVLINCTT